MLFRFSLDFTFLFCRLWLSFSTKVLSVIPPVLGIMYLCVCRVSPLWCPPFLLLCHLLLAHMCVRVWACLRLVCGWKLDEVLKIPPSGLWPMQGYVLFTAPHSYMAAVFSACLHSVDQNADCNHRLITQLFLIDPIKPVFVCGQASDLTRGNRYKYLATWTHIGT